MSAKLGPVLGFLDQLAHNNNKVWFDANRPAYEEARGIFEELVDSIIEPLRRSDGLGATLRAADCIPRINRDVRFSRDKSPYKTNFSAMIAPGGRKWVEQGYYLHIEPRGQSIVAGGLYMPSTEQLKRFRHAIATDATPFRKLIATPAFVKQFGALGGEKLKTAPQGYDRQHPNIDLLQHKQIIVARQFTDEEVLGGDLAAEVLKACKTMRPCLQYLNEVAGPSSCAS